MSVLLQISDTHFGTEQPDVVNALIDLSQQLRPDLLVLSGDITQRARPAQFRAARAFMDRLGAPRVAVPGNHDIALFNVMARLFWPYAHYCQAFGADLEPVHSCSNLLVQCVNTTRTYRHHHGEVSHAQIERIAARLERSSPEQLRVVVVHQPMAVDRIEESTHRVRGHAAALQRWSIAGADIVMGGHIHLPYVMAMPELPRPLWVVQAGTAISKRVRPGVPNSVNALHWDNAVSAALPTVLRIQQWDFNAVQQRFDCVRVTQVQPDRMQI
jgi:3',5'-cyclic AMP phosphodiesterase CpdA